MTARSRHIRRDGGAPIGCFFSCTPLLRLSSDYDFCYDFCCDREDLGRDLLSYRHRQAQWTILQ